MKELALTFEEICERSEFALSLISRENIDEIINVCLNTIRYLTNYTLIFLQEIDGRWYVN